MTVDQRRRLQLYEIARAQSGAEAADTLMELLPAVDISELATKQDLAVLASELRAEIAQMNGDLRAEMHAEFREQTNRLLMFVLPAVISGVGLAIAATRL